MANASNTVRAAAARKGKILPAVITETLAKPVITVAIDNDGICKRLRMATGKAVAGMEGARYMIAELVHVIREATAAKIDEATIGRNMQLGALMTKLNLGLDKACDALDADPRADDVKAVLHNFKTAKSRAYNVLKQQLAKEAAGEAKDGDKLPAAPRSAPAKGAKLLDKITVPVPVNAPDFHSQVLKIRTLLKLAIDQAEALDGAEADVRAAQQALALLPTK